MVLSKEGGARSNDSGSSNDDPPRMAHRDWLGQSDHGQHDENAPWGSLVVRRSKR